MDSIAEAEKGTPLICFPRFSTNMEEVRNHRQGRRRVAYAWRSIQWPTYASSAQRVVALLIVRVARNVISRVP